MTGHDLRFNLAAIAVALVLGGGIAMIASLMTGQPAPGPVSCTPATGCVATTGPRPDYLRNDPLAPTAPPDRR